MMTYHPFSLDEPYLFDLPPFEQFPYGCTPLRESPIIQENYLHDTSSIYPNMDHIPSNEMACNGYENFINSSPFLNHTYPPTNYSWEKREPQNEEIYKLENQSIPFMTHNSKSYENHNHNCIMSDWVYINDMFPDLKKRILSQIWKQPHPEGELEYIDLSSETLEIEKYSFESFCWLKDPNDMASNQEISYPNNIHSGFYEHIYNQDELFNKINSIEWNHGFEMNMSVFAKLILIKRLDIASRQTQMNDKQSFESNTKYLELLGASSQSLLEYANGMNLFKFAIKTILQYTLSYHTAISTTENNLISSPDILTNDTFSHNPSPNYFISSTPDSHSFAINSPVTSQSNFYRNDFNGPTQFTSHHSPMNSSPPEIAISTNSSPSYSLSYSTQAPYFDTPKSPQQIISPIKCELPSHNDFSVNYSSDSFSNINISTFPIPNRIPIATQFSSSSNSGPDDNSTHLEHVMQSQENATSMVYDYTDIPFQFQGINENDQYKEIPNESWNNNDYPEKAKKIRRSRLKQEYNLNSPQSFSISDAPDTTKISKLSKTIKSPKISKSKLNLGSQLYLHNKGCFRILWWEISPDGRKKREKSFPLKHYNNKQEAEDAAKNFKEIVDRQLIKYGRVLSTQNSDNSPNSDISTSTSDKDTQENFSDDENDSDSESQVHFLEWYPGISIPLGEQGRNALKKALNKKRSENTKYCDELLKQHELDFRQSSTFGYFTLRDLLHAANILGLWRLAQKFCRRYCKKMGFEIRWLEELKEVGLPATYQTLKKLKSDKMRNQAVNNNNFSFSNNDQLNDTESPISASV